MKTITRFLRYPGSKRRMLTFLSQYLPQAVSIDGIYVEPFVGSAAVYFSVDPQKAILTDLNPDLIDLLCGIQSSPSLVWHIYSNFGDTKQDYEYVRDQYKPHTLEEKAARVLYLNRTCFKGMWRTNMKGNFNVGYGGQTRRWVIDEENLIEVSKILKKAEIYCSDFEETIYKLSSGDFLFIDPPYRPGEKELLNDHYIGKTFRFPDHQRLGQALHWAKENGINWAMTTSEHPAIVGLFKSNYLVRLPQGTGKFPGVISQNPGEVLITSYPIAEGELLC
jgi:DNA adenine methylase